VFEDDIGTWGRVYDKSLRFANALIGLGVTPGDRVAILADNGLESFESYFGCLRAGAVRTGINPRLTTVEIEAQLAVAEPKVILVDSIHEEVLAKAISGVNLRSLEHVIGLRAGHNQSLDYQDLVANREAVEPLIPLDNGALVAIMFTSGSTGAPKAVMYTNDRIALHLYTSVASIGMRESDVWLQNLPVYGAPLIIATWNLVAGNACIVMPKFDIDDELHHIEKYGCTTFANSGTLISRLIDHPERSRYDLSSIHTIMYGQGPTSANLLTRAHEALPATKFFQSYGTTEGTIGIFSALTQRDHDRAFAAGDSVRLESAGRPLPNVILDIVDDDGVVLGEGEEGEVRIQSGTVSPGYYQDPDATAEVFRSDGLYTGDVGFLDETGFLHLVDRRAFMIVSAGYKLSSTEIENVMVEHPAIAEVCVIGVPDERWGEAVTAVVVPNPGQLPTEELREKILTFSRGKLAGYKVPKRLDFTDALPYSPQGKLLKGDLRKSYLSEGGRRIGAVD